MHLMHGHTWRHSNFSCPSRDLSVGTQPSERLKTIFAVPARVPPAIR